MIELKSSILYSFTSEYFFLLQVVLRLLQKHLPLSLLKKNVFEHPELVGTSLAHISKLTLAASELKIVILPSLQPIFSSTNKDSATKIDVI